MSEHITMVYSKKAVAAIKQGRMEALQEAYENDRGQSWGAHVCGTAAKEGRLELLKWLVDKGCPFDGEVVELAAAFGHVDVLEWALARGCPLSPATFANTAYKGENASLDLLWAAGFRPDLSDPQMDPLESAAGSGYCDTLKWFEDHGYTCNPELYQKAVAIRYDDRYF